MNCQCIPTHRATSIAVDTTTNVATITLDAATLATGPFNICFDLCGRRVGSCNAETLKIVAGTKTVTAVLRRDGNYATLGQCARQINCCRILHCNLTTSPANFVVILDRLPTCSAQAVYGSAPTDVTVE